MQRHDGTWRIRKNHEIEDMVSEPSIMGKIKSARLRWLEHQKRMPADMAVGPKYCWKVEVVKDLRALNAENWEEIKQDSIYHYL
ncbi:unnamed protein product, partial [Iphiclides podalirius]